MPSPHGLPGAELPWQVAPRDPAPVPVDDALHDRPRVRERATLTARPGREERRDQCPLIIGEELEARHPSSFSAVRLNLYETCPSVADRALMTCSWGAEGLSPDDPAYDPDAGGIVQ